HDHPDDPPNEVHTTKVVIKHNFKCESINTMQRWGLEIVEGYAILRISYIIHTFDVRADNWCE
ncbi:hypothetical protein ACVW0P_004538, partial [Mucilaginibacter sp. UYNi724]